MNILITGGTGLIGRAFIDVFHHYSFTILSRNYSIPSTHAKSHIKVIRSLNELENLNNFDAIINLAGEPIIEKRWSLKQKDIICKSRWKITSKLVELFSISDNPPKVFISGSAIGVYGSRKSQLITEGSLTDDIDFPSKLCLHWENIAKQAEPFTRVILIRTGIVLSCSGGALAKMLPAFKLGLGGPISNGQQYMSWIHYLDHINAMHHVLKNNKIKGVINLVSPNPETNQTFTRLLARSVKRPSLLTMPNLFLKILLGEASCLLLDSQRVTPNKLLINGFDFKFPSLESAFNDLLAPARKANTGTPNNTHSTKA